MAAKNASQKKYIVVFHSTTKGVETRTVSHHDTKGEADQEAGQLNRGIGLGGWYAAHVAARYCA